jgi:hypothetical protein
MLACGDDDRTAGAPGGTSVGTGDSDSAVVAPIDDAGQDTDDSGLGPATSGKCVALDPAVAANEDLAAEDRPSYVDTPSDFAPTRAYVYWEGDCLNPEIHVQLSNGSCAKSRGHQITFEIPVNGIRDGLVIGGENALAEDKSTAIRVRYLRPEGFEPTGAWGTCPGVKGVVAFLTEPSITTRAQWVATFQFDRLTDCSGGDLAKDPQTVSGGFNVRLPQTVLERCPMWK